MLPVPTPADLQAAWDRLQPSSALVDEWLASGRWTEVVTRVDDVLLRQVMGLEPYQIDQLRTAAETLRSRRLTRSQPAPPTNGQ